MEISVPVEANMVIKKGGINDIRSKDYSLKI
ncbi:MAG: hypothetical protein A4E44_00551 [Methanosaeta sp. PtaB.Bin018]|nr:MAG: hypothetical protein A4E44_00551 [Methanosaeta sp. PtaB.Bin018]